MVGEFYSLSVKAPIIVEWYKSVNGIELSHAVAVYQNEARQQELLKQFLEAENGNVCPARTQLLER